MERSYWPNTAAIIAEPIQVEDGVIIPPYGYLIGLRKLVTIMAFFLIINEAMTGLGRTGYMFGCEWRM
jgi:acetylornithine/succinyldiaminopimelate/putrescine aminotransferase